MNGRDVISALKTIFILVKKKTLKIKKIVKKVKVVKLGMLCWYAFYHPWSSLGR